MRFLSARLAFGLLAALGILSCTDTPTSLQRPLVAPAAARRDAASGLPAVIISQVYGGGGNSGSTYTNDFIELFNPASQPVSLTGYSVQYASSAGSTWQVTNLSGSIPAGGYYLVQESKGAGGTTPLPTPDATGTIAMAAGAGKVVVLATTTAQTGTCPAGVVDQVSFGTAATDCGFKTTPTIDNATAAIRGEGGCAYTGDLSVDFTKAAPTPRNTASPTIAACTGGGIVIGPLDHVAVAGGTSVTVGTSTQLSATPQDASNHTVTTATVTWSSSDPGIASVDATGKVTGVATSPNPVTITATAVDNGVTKTGAIQVTVSIASIKWIDISSSSASFPPGFQTQLFATARTAQGGPIVDATFTFEAIDPAIATIATVQNTGIVTGVAAPADGTTKPGFRVIATPVDGSTPPDTFVTHPITIETPNAAPTTIYAKNDEFGDPTSASASNANDLLIVRPEYTISYNESHGTPNWVSYELDARQMVAGQDRCNCFTADPLLPANKQILTSDYTNGGFDRGHMTRSADRTAGNVDNATTFYLTNVVPQIADLNQGVWAQFENALADSANKGGRAVYIITGPLYSATHQLTFLKNEGKVAVPDSTWKIALIGPVIDGVPFKLGDIQTWDDLAGVTVLAVNMPNIAGVRNDPWQKYLTTVDRIETSTGYNFLSLLQTSYQDAVEAGDHRPVASFSMSGTTNEGSSLKFDASASTDPDLGRDDLGRAEALTYTWHFSDGGQTSGKVVYHTFHDNGSFTATLTVADAFGWERNSMQTVVVANVTPSVTFGATTPTSILSGDAVSAAGGFTDPGDDAAWHTLIDWGNGAMTPGTFNASGASITGSSIFLALGSYTVTLSVTDKDGATGSNSFSVNVAPRPVPTTIESPTINLNGNGNGNVSLTLTNGNGVDVSLVDISSIRLGSVGVARNGSGFQSEVRGGSLILNFSRLALTNAGVLTPSTTELDLTGSLTTGVQIAAAVSVVVH